MGVNKIFTRRDFLKSRFRLPAVYLPEQSRKTILVINRSLKGTPVLLSVAKAIGEVTFISREKSPTTHTRIMLFRLFAKSYCHR